MDSASRGLGEKEPRESGEGYKFDAIYYKSHHTI